MSVANTIRNQIGGRALFMLGAQNLLGGQSSLSFKVRGSRKVTHIRVKYEPSDTYTVEFIKVRGTKITQVATRELVYADGLNQVIEHNTGLRTSL